MGSVMTMKDVGDKEKKGKQKKQYLYHYLSLNHLISILKNRQLCFCNPEYWDDKNDACFAKLAMPKGKAIGVICFTKTRETCTHWKAFASKGIGVKISFLQNELLDSLKKNIEKDEKILDSSIVYKARKNILKTNDTEIDKSFMPLFLKKSAYNNEKEYRVACIVNARVCEDFGKVIRRIEMPLSCISRITISPYVQKSVACDIIKLLKAYIESVKVDSESLNIEVKHSTMMYDQKWQMAGRNLVEQIKKEECVFEEDEK